MTTTKKKSKSFYILGELDIDIENISKLIYEINEYPDWNVTSTVNLFISSQGGDLHCTFAIIDLLEEKKRKYNVKFITHGLGCVGSGGFFLFLLGDERILYPKCRTYVHEHICVDSEELPFTLQELSHEEDKAINKIYTEWIASRLDITFKKAKELLVLNKWLTAEEISRFNIVTKALKNE